MSLKTVIATLALVMAGSASAGKVVVAANSPIGTLDRAAIQGLFLGRTSSAGGAPATILYQRGPVRGAFETGVLAKTGPVLAAHWSKLVFTGRAKAPTELGSDAEVKARVASTPGAIGYISDEAVDATVKVIFEF